MKKTKIIHILCGWTGNRNDVHWFCQTQPPEVSIFMRSGAKKWLLVPAMEYRRMVRCVDDSVRVIAPGGDGLWMDGCVEWIKKQFFGATICAGSSAPFGLTQRLKDAGVRVEFSRKPACPGREIKTHAERKQIRMAQRAAVEAMDVAVQMIASSRIGKGGVLRKGAGILTSEQVRAQICHHLFDAGCVVSDIIVSCGSASADPHETGSGPLRAGQPIVIDIFPRLQASGYWGDMTRTVCKGAAPEALHRQYAAVKAAHAAALRTVRAGVRTDAVHRAAGDAMQQRGYRTGRDQGVPRGFIHATGHGVGLDVHEEPRIRAGCRRRLKAGHVVTIEPGLYYPETGGVRIEDTVFVTEKGFQKAASYPVQLEV